MKFMGIDPGVSGGIAVVDEYGACVSACKMPGTERDILDAIQGSAADRAVLEFVRSSPQMGRVSVWTFGRGYGALRMALVAARVPFDEVTPQAWQQEINCRARGDKNLLKARAQELFPSVRVTLAIADALLMAEYCRRINWRLYGKAEVVVEVEEQAGSEAGEKRQVKWRFREGKGAAGAC